MTANEVIIRQNATLNVDDKLCSVSLGSGAAETLMTFTDGRTYFYTRTGRRARLMFVGNAVDPGYELYIHFHVYINGTRALPPYDDFSQAIGLTYDPGARMAVPMDLPQGALIQVKADAPGAVFTSNGGAYARLRIEYEDF